MKIFLPVVALILVVGAIASAKGAVAQGDNANSPRVPVPFTPTKNPGNAVGYRFRGMYIGIYELDDGTYDWHVYATRDFSVADIAVDETPRVFVAEAVTSAMQWIDAMRGGPLA